MMAKMLEYGSDVCQNLLAGGLPNAGSGSNAYGDQDAEQFSSDNKYVYIPWLGDISGLMSPPNQRWDTHFVERLEVSFFFLRLFVCITYLTQKKTIGPNQVRKEYGAVRRGRP